MYLQSSESAILTPGVTQDLKTAWLEEEAISWQFSRTELEQFLQSNLSSLEENQSQIQLTGNPGHGNSTESSGRSKTATLGS